MDWSKISQEVTLDRNPNNWKISTQSVNNNAVEDELEKRVQKHTRIELKLRPIIEPFSQLIFHRVVYHGLG